MAYAWYDFQLTRRGRAEGNVFTDALDLDDVQPAKVRLLMILRAAIVRTNGSLRDQGEYALELRERGGRDVVMTFATHGEVNDR
jgi:hypothetical protein